MKLFGKKFFAYLLVALIVLTSIPMTAFADGEVNQDDSIITEVAPVYPSGVMVQHYDVESLIGYPNSPRSEDTWESNGFNTKLGTPVFKSGAVGTINNSPLTTKAFIYNDVEGSDISKTAQRLYGYVTPTRSLSSFEIKLDDGAMLKMDTDQDGILEDVTVEGMYRTQAPKSYIINKALVANKTYRFEIQYYNWGGNGALYFKTGDMPFPQEWFSVNPTPQATEDDTNNVILGANGMMEIAVSLDNGLTWTPWAPYTPDLTFPNRHTVKLRYKDALDAHEVKILPNGDKSESRLLQFYKQINVTFKPSISILKDGVYSNPTDSFIATSAAGKVSFTSGIYSQESSGAELNTVLVDGDSVSVKAIPNIGYEFDKWAEDYVTGAPQRGDQFSVTISDLVTTITPSAVFVQMPSHTVTFMAKDRVVKTEVVQYGGAATAPRVANTLEEDFVNWDRGFTNVKDNIIVNATWRTVANFWITVDDFHDVYVNGAKLTNPDQLWSTVDRHLVALYLDPNKRNTIAVKGFDQTTEQKAEGLNSISGFKAILKLNGKWYVTNGNWDATNDSKWSYSLAPQMVDSFGLNWFDGNYAPSITTDAAAWLQPHVIANPDGAWPMDSAFPTLPTGKIADWIWSPKYKVVDNARFDSPVYFRMVVGEDKYPVKFVGKTTSGAATTFKLVDVVHGGTTSAPTDITAPEGQRFKSWSGDYARVITGTTVTAVYEDLYFNVRFVDFNGNLVKSEQVKWNESATKPGPALAPRYQEFLSWGPETAYQNIKSAGSDGFVTIHAQYKMQGNYTVNFFKYDGIGGSPMFVTSATPGGAVIAMAPIPTREGYRFVQWYTKGRMSMPAETTEQISFMPMQFTAKTPVEYDNLNVYGAWIQQYKVTFDSTGGSAVSPILKDHNTPVVTPPETLPVPNRPGYTFINWTYVVEDETKVLAATDMFAWDFTATANWSLNPVTVDDETPTRRTIVVPETPAPQAAPPTATAPVVDVPTAVVPLAVVTLPKTGELPATLFYGLGGLLGGIGVFMRRKK